MNMKSDSSENISNRKKRHLDVCLSENVEGGKSGFSEIRFKHRVFPEVDYDAVDLTVPFCGKRIRMPLFISCMTGGSAGGYTLNKSLAQLAREAGIPVGLGSIRVLFRHPEFFEHFHLRPIAGDVPVIANIGAVQLRDMDSASLIEMCKRLEVDALAVHLNPAQEIFQAAGDRNFIGVKESLKRFLSKCPIPVIVKETGCGILPEDTKMLIDSGASYVDIAGAGGTNWITVEQIQPEYEEKGGADISNPAEEFADWGIGTAYILNKTIHEYPELRGKLLSSGGIRKGMDAAASVALGAAAAGMALPFAREVALNGLDAGIKLVEDLERVLRSVCFLQGKSQILDLSTDDLLFTSSFLQESQQL